MTDLAGFRATTEDPVAEVTAWLEENWDPDLTVDEWWERLGRSGWAAPTWPVEWYGKGLSRPRACGSRAPSPSSARSAPRAASACCSPGPTIATHGTDEQKERYLRDIVTGQEGVVPAVQRARRRLRPRRSADQGRSGRRRVDRQRPEGVDLGRPGRRPRHAARPHRPRRAQAPGHHLLRHRHAPARRRGPAAEGDDRPGDVQRGVPHRRPRPRRRRDRRAQQRLGGRQHDAHARARRPRRRRRLAARSPRPPAPSAGDLDKRAGDFVGPAAHSGAAVAAACRRAGQLLIELAKGNGTIDDPTIRQDLDAPALAERDRPVHQPPRQGPRARRARTSPAPATSPSCR